MSFNVPNIFTPGTKAKADEVNENFSSLEEEINRRNGNISEIKSEVDYIKNNIRPKIDEYEIKMVNGQSTVIKTEKCGDEHGARSVRYLSELIPLTNEEILCIRYHMGPYIRQDWVGYDNAIKQYEF